MTPLSIKNIKKYSIYLLKEIIDLQSLLSRTNKSEMKHRS